MTRNEQTELNELEMTEAQLAERTRAITEKLHSDVGGSILHRDGHSTEFGPSRQRKTRADKGVPKGPKLVQEAPAGAINSEQKSKLMLLMALVQQTTTEHMQVKAALDEAFGRMTRAQSDFTAYLNSLTV